MITDDIRDIVVREMGSKDLSCDKLSEKAHVSKHTIKKVRTGRTVPVSSICNILETLGYSLCIKKK